MNLLRAIPLTGQVADLIIFALLALIILALCLPPRRRFLLRAALPSLLVGGIVAGGAWYLISVRHRLVPEGIDLRIFLASGLAIAAMGLALARLFSLPKARVGRGKKVAAALGATLALLAAPLLGLGMGNVVYHLFPSAYSLLSAEGPRTITYEQAEAERAHPSPDKPPASAVVRTQLANTASRFTTTPALVYLPPAYFAGAKDLPVVVLIAGVPGGPDDWFSLGEAHLALDDYAALHGGVSPIVVAVDANGSQFHDTLCVDSKEGNVDTYLSEDVRDDVVKRFHTASDAKRWAVVGLSRGGTCSLQLVAHHPDKFATFVNMSGELHPQTTNVDATIKQYFDGDAQAYADAGAEKILTNNALAPGQKSGLFAGVAGRFIAGENDHSAQVDLRQLDRLARAAGIDSAFNELPGAHTWQVWREGFADSLGFLGERLGIGAGHPGG
nr:alpha/beta fold hydrolase [Corynebacterium lactis]